MSLEGLQERLVALQETTTQLKELIDRLANLKFQPGSVPLGTEEETSVSGELSAEISLILRNGLEDQQLLSEEVKYLRPDGHEKKRLEEGIERVASDLYIYRSALRKARLSAKKSLEQAQKLERRLMLQSFAEPFSEPVTPVIAEEGELLPGPVPVMQHVPRHTKQVERSSLSEEDQQNVGASNNVTNALRRTHALIAAELTRSEFAHQTLMESSEALKKLDESYTSLDSMLASSKNLLGTLLKSQKSDTWYLQTAMYMLLVTGAWLIFRRLLYGPIWWIVWLPLRVVFGVGSKASSAVMYRSPAESEKASVGTMDGNVPVQGLPDENLPTLKVGGETKQSAQGSGMEDSMVDKVGKIVDAVNDVGSQQQEIEGQLEQDAQEEVVVEHSRDEL